MSLVNTLREIPQFTQSVTFLSGYQQRTRHFEFELVVPLPTQRVLQHVTLATSTGMHAPWADPDGSHDPQFRVFHWIINGMPYSDCLNGHLSSGKHTLEVLYQSTPPTADPLYDSGLAAQAAVSAGPGAPVQDREQLERWSIVLEAACQNTLGQLATLQEWLHHLIQTFRKLRKEEEPRA